MRFTSDLQVFRFLAPFTCEHEGKRYRSFEKFNAGPHGCAQCICLDGRVDCDESNCKTPASFPISPATTPREATTVASVVRESETSVTRSSAPVQGSEKGPSASELSYYASQLTDVASGDKGPATAGLSYLPEQYQYMQAQTGPIGPRGPPGKYFILICRFVDNSYSISNCSFTPL